MDLETKFITLDNKESDHEKVDMKETVVFYPYFHFNAAKSTNVGKGLNGADKAYRIIILLKGFYLQQVRDIEKAFSTGRSDGYGFWTVKNPEGSFIGMGAASLCRMMEKSPVGDAYYALLMGTDVLFMVKFRKDASGYPDALLEVYFSDADCGYSEKLKAVDALLTGAKLKEAQEELKSELLDYKFLKYSYHKDSNKPKPVHKNHSVSAAPTPKAFLEHVHGCAWHTVVYNDNVINDGPHFVLLKNCSLGLGNILDELSCWLVHRRGGFVMGKEFASNDFSQETTFIIREIDEYRMGGMVLLNIECDTYSKNRDEGLEAFLKNISEARFR